MSKRRNPVVYRLGCIRVVYPLDSIKVVYQLDSIRLERLNFSIMLNEGSYHG